jgi:hypothetical protein
MASATGAAPPATGTWVITIIAAIFYGSFSVVPSLQKKEFCLPQHGTLLFV